MSQRSHQTYKSHWWIVEVPADWEATEDAAFVSLTSGPGAAVQVSAAKKDCDITDEDVLEFARDRIGDAQQIERIDTTHFTGFHAEYSRDGIRWREWWLRSGPLMLYVTYNSDQANGSLNRSIVDRIVASLEPIKQ